MNLKTMFKGSALSAIVAVVALGSAPAFAAPRDGAQRENPRFERQAPREVRAFRPEASRPAREERSARPQAAPAVPREARQQPRFERPAQVPTARADGQANFRNRDNANRGFALDPNRGRQDARSEQWQGRRVDRRASDRDRRNDGRDARQDQGDWQRDRRDGGFALDPNRYTDRDRNRTYRDGYRDGRHADRRDDRRDNTRSYRNGYRDGRHSGYNNHRDWDRRWRDNRRYDWYGYRNHNRSIYRLGRYYSPYRDYSYRRLSIGFSLDSLFFGSRYWINDPWQYRLPEVYGPYRWVRYYDDVLLVNIYSGEVVDVIYDFFW